MSESRGHGLATGFGAATADAVYGIIGGFGLTLFSQFLTDQQVWLHLLGGWFLCYLGIKIFLAKSSVDGSTDSRAGLAKAYFSAFFLTLSNPMTILSFAAIFAGLGLSSAGGDYLPLTMLVTGIFGGSMLWWVMLSFGASKLLGGLKQNRLTFLNKAAALILIAFGIAAFVSVI